MCCKGKEGDQRGARFPGKDPLKCSTNNNGCVISLSNRGGALRAAPALSLRLHREAPADAADPVAALPASCCSYPKEGRVSADSRKHGADGGVLSMVRSLTQLFVSRSMSHGAPAFSQGFHDAFHCHRSGALNQHHVARQDRLAQVGQGFLDAATGDRPAAAIRRLRAAATVPRQTRRKRSAVRPGQM